MEWFTYGYGIGVGTVFLSKFPLFFSQSIAHSTTYDVWQTMAATEDIRLKFRRQDLEVKTDMIGEGHYVEGRPTIRERM